jgi:hypothetical protein
MTMAFTILRHLFGYTEPVQTQPTSPQGWRDVNPAWPPPGVSHFTSPWAAVDAAESALADLKLLSGCRPFNLQADDLGAIRYQLALQQFESALETLSLAGGEIVLRKGTFGRLAHLLAAHLPALSHLVRDTQFNAAVFRVIQGLKQCTDADIAQKGQELEDCLHRMSANAA